MRSEPEFTRGFPVVPAEYFDEITAAPESAAVGDLRDLQGGMMQQINRIFQPQSRQKDGKTDPGFTLEQSAQIGGTDAEPERSLFQRDLRSIIFRHIKFHLLDQLGRTEAHLRLFRRTGCVPDRIVKQQQQSMELDIKIGGIDQFFRPESVEEIQPAADFRAGGMIQPVQLHIADGPEKFIGSLPGEYDHHDPQSALRFEHVAVPDIMRDQKKIARGGRKLQSVADLQRAFTIQYI